MPEERTVKFTVKPIGRSYTSHRFWYAITLPFRRTVPAVALATLFWAVVYNVGVRYWKGPDHPVNRFRWRRMKKEGLLSDELLEKERVVLEYHKSRILDPPPGPYTHDLYNYNKSPL
ncbi:hypothetical protein V3C99_010989 [Haemonchus contortus]